MGNERTELDGSGFGIGGTEAVEVVGSGNLFSEFVSKNSTEFAMFADLSAQQRRIDEDFRARFTTEVGGSIHGHARLVDRLTAKNLAKLTRFAYDQVFDLERSGLSDLSEEARQAIFDSPNDSVEVDRAIEGVIAGERPTPSSIYALSGKTSAIPKGKLDALQSALPTQHGLGTHTVHTEISEKIRAFQLRYLASIGSVYLSRIDSFNQITEKFYDYIISRYKSVVEIEQFLDDPKYIEQRELVASYFRLFILTDVEERRRNGGADAPTTGLREYWQDNLKTGFNSDLFERFWDEVQASPSHRDILDMVRFGVMIARLNRDEDPSEAGINFEDIKHAIGKVPIESWPKALRDAYLSFGNKDVAMLIERIRNKLIKLYPPLSNGNLRIDEVSDAESTKRKGMNGGVVRNSGERVGEGKREAVGASGAVEADKRVYGLGRIKMMADGRRNVQILKAEPDQLEEMIIELASIGKTPQMKEDFAAIIKALVEDPYRPGSKKMNGRGLSMGGISMPWRRFDPRMIRGLSFKDPETARYRIMYIVHELENIVGIRVILHHNVFDQLETSREV